MSGPSTPTSAFPLVPAGSTTGRHPAKVPAAVEFVFPDGSTRSIQVNFCKNPRCANFGVPASLAKYARRASAGSAPGTEYTLAASGRDVPTLFCRLCGENLPVKSNLGIAEELERRAGPLRPPAAPSCPARGCANATVPVTTGAGCYKRFGRTDQGSQRWRCLACGKTFSEPKRTTLRQRLPRRNQQVFRLLVNKMPLRRVCESAGIAMQTLYDKLGFIHRQAVAFAARRERKLLDGMAHRRLYVAVDRQDYAVNWSQRRDRRNVVLRAIGSADLASGYVFGMDLNFDGTLDPALVEAAAAACGDYGRAPAYRRYGRLWLEPDYARAVAEGAARARARKSGGLAEDIEGRYEEAGLRADVESPEVVSGADALPRHGMQVRNEYTMYGHFFWLRQLFRGAEKVRFFMDQESGIRAACLAAFEQEVKQRRCDAFYVRIGKELTVAQKRRAVEASRAALAELQARYPTLTQRQIEMGVMKERIRAAAAIGKWSDRWVAHPWPDYAEPQKAVCWLTDFGDLDEDHAANLVLMATLHPIDRFFMQIRRRLSLLERPIGTTSKAGRTWYGYSAYQPANIVRVLDVFRVYYNYCLAGKDGKTPAMRLGLVERIASVPDILLG